MRYVILEEFVIESTFAAAPADAAVQQDARMTKYGLENDME